MSYNIGQLRRNQISKYETPITLLDSMVGSLSTVEDSGMTIKNSCINIPTGTLKKDINYFFTFKLSNNNSTPKNFVVNLRGGEKEQPVKFFNKAIKNNQYTMVFTPNDNVYTQIVFEITSRTDTYTVVNLDTTHVNHVLQNIQLSELVNVVPKLDGVSSIKKIGLQGPPGLLFSMNGEEIHIGKTGIYEAEDVNINNLSFVIRNSSPVPYNDGKDFFIMDYMYNKEVE